MRVCLCVHVRVFAYMFCCSCACVRECFQFSRKDHAYLHTCDAERQADARRNWYHCDSKPGQVSCCCVNACVSFRLLPCLHTSACVYFSVGALVLGLLVYVMRPSTNQFKHLRFVTFSNALFLSVCLSPSRRTCARSLRCAWALSDTPCLDLPGTGTVTIRTCQATGCHTGHRTGMAT